MYVSLSNGTVNAIKNNLVFRSTCGKKVHNGLSLYFLSFKKKLFQIWWFWYGKNQLVRRRLCPNWEKYYSLKSYIEKQNMHVGHSLLLRRTRHQTFTPSMWKTCIFKKYFVVQKIHLSSWGFTDVLEMLLCYRNCH